ncbi:hypothetical protein ABZ896_34310 [Streptomyces sp. NPDC047072]|uniref:hypothetical protein n=1 Tax=Streptomyces sp. NPDC047072 TaxID=3154809 RepID=UPI0033F805AB
MAGPTVRRGVLLGFGVLWWWAVARLVLARDAGLLEASVAAGGWGLSVLPVHCVPKARAAGAVAAGRWRQAWQAGSAGPRGASTTASPPRRSDAGSDPS